MFRSEEPIRGKCTCRTCIDFPAINPTLTKCAPMTDLDEKIILIHKSVVIFHSIIMFKLVLSFTFQAETDFLNKAGQFWIFLPNSLLPSFGFETVMNS